MLGSFEEMLQATQLFSDLNKIGIVVEQGGWWVGDDTKLSDLNSLPTIPKYTVMKQCVELGVVEVYFPSLDLF